MHVLCLVLYVLCLVLHVLYLVLHVLCLVLYALCPSNLISSHEVPGVPANLYWRMGWDGMDGWMDGRSVNFFLVHISNTTRYFLLNISYPLYLGFCTSFGVFLRKKSESSFFQKISQKSKISLNLSRIFQISRKLLNIFPDCFWSPYKSFEDIYWKIQKQKNNRKFFNTKISELSFSKKKCLWKNFFFRNISTTQYFFLIVFGPLKRIMKTYLGIF